MHHPETASVADSVNTNPLCWSRRRWLQHGMRIRQLGAGLGAGLGRVVVESGRRGRIACQPAGGSAAAFRSRAKRVIFLFMNGGPSHVDTFDPKPALEKYAGEQPEELTKDYQRSRQAVPSPFKFGKYGANGIDVSELYPHVAKVIDDICVIRSMHSAIPNHEPALLMMNSGNMQPAPQPGLMAHLWPGDREPEPAGLRRALPRQAGRRAAVVGQQLPARHLQGCHINNSKIDPSRSSSTFTTATCRRNSSGSSSICCNALISASGRGVSTTRGWNRGLSRWRWRSACNLPPRTSSI